MPSDADMALLTKPHNYWNNPPSNAWQVSVADYVGLTIAAILVLARCYTKWGILKRSGWEDCTIPTSYNGFQGQSADLSRRHLDRLFGEPYRLHYCEFHPEVAIWGWASYLGSPT